ncbi:hypothetical protein LS77_010880 [Helicobacter bilis]|uniref:Uncharacterized protein n=2 Tax=Helicobacter bilis TaxID=37372 RepID=A0A6D2C5Y4_9HELI|nr:hypothetical protein [Helicobacter bilis]EMZ36918.1 hypothetical protein C826_02316 [Helicobacter bilis WiWa]TLE02358.1 hypothetical protein LS77_010880 [Helicobacter bilis]TLE02987.1 hypothetical protein LS76_010880 [Helicobacter bilis]
MRLIIFVFCIAYSIVYASGSVHFAHFQDMLSSQTSYNSTLQKDKETTDKIYHKGTITLSGVLEWQMYREEVDFYWRLVFFPDVPSALPRLFEYDTQAIFLNDALKRNIEFQKNSFLQIYNVLPNQLNQADEYILGGIAIRATLTLENYYIEKHLDSEADARYYAIAKIDSTQTLNNVRKPLYYPSVTKNTPNALNTDTLNTKQKSPFYFLCILLCILFSLLHKITSKITHILKILTL